MFWIMMAAALIADRLSKYLIVSNLALGQSAPFLGDFMQFTYTLNRGASFSILQGQRWLFVALTVLVLAVVIWFHFKQARQEKLLDALLGLFCGGALGNLIDRLSYGAVIDFLDLGWFPIFNIADSCIVVSVIWLCILILFGETGKRLDKKHE